MIKLQSQFLKYIYTKIPEYLNELFWNLWMAYIVFVILFGHMNSYVLYADTNCKLVENVVDKCATNVHTDKANF